MNFDRNKTFPYPVLRPYSDDYLGVDFQATPELKVDGNTIQFDCTYLTSCSELANQVLAGRAKYVSVLSCRDTYCRETLTTGSTFQSQKFDAEQFRGEVRIDSYIACTKPIEVFYSKDINPEFGSTAFTFKPGQLLAQDETTVVFIDRDLFKPLTSVFDLVKNESLQQNEWRVALDENNVQIQVSPLMKGVLDDARNTTPNRAVLLNSIYFGAVTQCLQKLKESAEAYSDLPWAMVILHQLQNKGIDIAKAEPYVLAQQLMKYPLGVLRAHVFKEQGN